MSGRRFPTLLIAATCAGLAGLGTASAKPASELDDYAPTGSHIRLKPTVLGDRARNLAITEFSRCLVRDAEPQVDQYLRNSDAMGSNLDPQKLLPMADCLGEAMSEADQSQARFSMQGLRGWLAEVVYLKRNKKFVALPADAPRATARQFFSTGGRLRLAQRVGEFSDCIVARNPSGADAILRSSRGSSAEFEASKAFAPTLSACVEGNSEVSFNSETLRAYVADGLWQRYEAGKPLLIKGGR